MEAIVGVASGSTLLALVLAAPLAVLGYLAGRGASARQIRGADRQRTELREDIGALQRALLEPVPERVGGIEASVAYRPSEGPAAGGDFYDALEMSDGRAAFILGDVSGHGRDALAHTAFIRYTLRAYLEGGLSPREVLQVAGRVVDPRLGGDFATVVIAVHDPETATLEYACAGHPAPIVVGPARPEPVLVASSPPIGLDLRTGLRQTTVPVPPGSVVCLYTDGLAEARSIDRRIIGRPWLADMVEELAPEQTATDLLERVSSEARVISDDMVAFVLRPTGGKRPDGNRREQLEVNAEEARTGLAQRFLEACGLDEETATLRAIDAEREALDNGAALIEVSYAGSGPTRTSILPMLSPASMPMKAAGIASMPSKTVSR